MSYFYMCPHHPDEGACREQPFGKQDRDSFCPECGEKFAMPYIYDICPWCMDELVETNQLAEGGYSDKFCPKCGRKLEAAMMGTQKVDDTIYKIILEKTSISYEERKNIFIKLLMKMGNISFDEALNRYQTKDSVIFEGDAREVYINMDSIDGYTDAVRYRVVPDFPFLRLADPFICICPTCGGDVIYKEKERGFFCEKCDWSMLPL